MIKQYLSTIFIKIYIKLNKTFGLIMRIKIIKNWHITLKLKL